MGLGRRVGAPSEQSQRSAKAEGQQALAEFILAMNPATAFNPSSAGLRRALDGARSGGLHQQHRSFSPLTVSPRATAPDLQAAAQVGQELDLVGDAGVIKTIVNPGTGAKPPAGSTVEVHYEGRLADTGAVFDSSRSRGQTFKFTLGQGKVIGGWEVGISSMKVGEVSTLRCAPQYAYGAKGVPPMIPPGATLQFEVELIGVAMPDTKSAWEREELETPRTAKAIEEAYQRRIRKQVASTPVFENKFEEFKSWASKIYIFGFFSEKKDRPPWFLNPIITFPIIFVFVGVLFYLTSEIGGIHRGVDLYAEDDLKGFLDLVPPTDATD